MRTSTAFRCTAVRPGAGDRAVIDASPVRVFDRSVEAAMVAAVVVLAAYLRFTAIGWGLSHPAEVDERYFVENVATSGIK